MAEDRGSADRALAAAEFDKQFGRGDGARVAASLADGLRMLCDAFLTRVYSDVEKRFGIDSMLIPTSLVSSEEKTHQQIEIYAVAESAACVSQRRYLPGGDDWYGTWLARLLIGKGAAEAAVMQRLNQYVSRSPDDRRRAFSRVLERNLPESMRCPLIVYRLLPPAVGIVTATALGDLDGAATLRNEQIELLPGIADCHACHGRLLEIGESCATCGNPFWKFNWLTAD